MMKKQPKHGQRKTVIPRTLSVQPRSHRPGINKVIKWYYQAFSTTAISSSGSLTSLAAVANGTGYNGRLGSKIHVDFVRVRLLLLASLQSSIATADIYNNVRVIVALAKGPASGITTSDFPLIGPQFDNKEPVKPLYDRTVYLNNLSSGLASAGSAYGATPSGVWLQDLEGGSGAGYFDIPVNRDVVFDSTSATSDDNNMPLLYIVSDSSVTPNPTVTGEVRAFYRDIVD